MALFSCRLKAGSSGKYAHAKALILILERHMFGRKTGIGRDISMFLDQYLLLHWPIEVRVGCGHQLKRC